MKLQGNATPDKVLKGSTFLSTTSKELQTGTMNDNGAVSKTLNAGGSYTIPKGYHNGSGKVSANSLASQTDGSAVAGDIKKGKTAWVKGNKITGTYVEPTINMKQLPYLITANNGVEKFSGSIDIGSSKKAKAITVICAINRWTSANRYQKLTVYGSNNNSSWEVIKSVTDQDTVKFKMVNVSIANLSKAYRYYRFGLEGETNDYDIFGTGTVFY